MASGIINTVNSLLARLADIDYTWGNTAGKPYPTKLFQFVAMFNDQINREAEGDGILFGKPAALVCLELNAQSNMIGNYSQTDYYFKIHLVDDQISSGNGQLDQNLGVITLRNYVKRNLINFTPTNCTRLMLVDETTDESHTHVYDYVLTFKGNVLDNTGTIDDSERTDIVWTEPETIDPNLTVEIWHDQ